MRALFALAEAGVSRHVAALDQPKQIPKASHNVRQLVLQCKIHLFWECNHMANDWRDLPDFARMTVRPDLQLRRLAANDADDVLRILAEDPSIRDRVKVVSEATTADDIRAIAASREGSLSSAHFVILEAGSAVGLLSLWRAGGHFGDLVDPDSYGFGYFLSPRARGRGIIPAVLHSVMETTCRCLPVHSFVAFCEDDNPASSRNLDKAGLKATSVAFTNSKGWRERLYERPVADAPAA